MSNGKNVNLAESIISGMVVGGITPTELLVGLHNVMSWGRLWTDNCKIGQESAIEDRDLRDVMEKIDQIIVVSKRVDG